MGGEYMTDWLAAAIDDDAAISDAAIATHHRHIQTALDCGSHSVAVMMLSAFYESAVSAAIEQHADDLRKEADSRDDIADSMATFIEYRIDRIAENADGFSSLLDEAADHGILDAATCDLLHDLRRERNAYMHDAACITRQDCAQLDNNTELHDLEDSCNLYADILASSQQELDGAATLTTGTSTYSYSVPGTRDEPWKYPKRRGQGGPQGTADRYIAGARPRRSRTAAAA